MFSAPKVVIKWCGVEWSGVCTEDEGGEHRSAAAAAAAVIAHGPAHGGAHLLDVEQAPSLLPLDEGHVQGGQREQLRGPAVPAARVVLSVDQIAEDGGIGLVQEPLPQHIRW